MDYPRWSMTWILACFLDQTLATVPGTSWLVRIYTFIVGTRTSGQAADGLFYSRALQANTTHYYQATCGVSTATGQFTTVNPPLGNSFPEPFPFNSAAWGNYAWPTINWNDQTQVYVDPLTGIAIKRFSSPGHFYGTIRGVTVAGDSAGVFSYQGAGTNWTNPANILGNSQGTVATYSAATSDPIFVAWGLSGLPDSGGFAGFPPVNGNGGVTALDNVQVAFYGSGTDATGSNRQVEVCLSFYDSGGTCNTPFQVVTLPNSAPGSGTSAVFPSSGNFPDSGYWAGWSFNSGNAPLRNDIAVCAGNYSSAVSTITNTGGNCPEFNLNWKSGGKIFLSGTNPTCTNNICTISSVTNGNTLVITQNIGTLSGTFYSLTSGIVLKKVTATGSVSVSLGSNYTQSVGLSNPNGGDNTLCSLNATTVSYAADGTTPITPVAGELCSPYTKGSGIMLNPVPSLYTLIPSTGETRYHSPLFIDNQANAASSGDYTISHISGQWASAPFDSSNANVLYLPFQYLITPLTVGGYISQAQHSVATTTYTLGGSCRYQSYTHSLYPNIFGASYFPGQDTGVAASPGRMWTDSCLSYDSHIYTLSNPATFGSIDYRIVTTDTNWKNWYQSNAGEGISVVAVRYGKIWANSGPGGQNQAAWVGLMDAPTGAINFSGTSLTGPTYNLRWAVNHSTSIGTPINTFGLNSQLPNGNQSNGMPFMNGEGRGPFVFKPTCVFKSGVCNANTSIAATNPDPATETACPGGLATNLVQQGATGTNCITFQAQMACSAVPYWPQLGTTTLAAQANSTQTSLTLASAASLPATPFYIYVTFYTTPGNTDTFARYQAAYPASELIYVTTVVGTNLLTVTRNVNGGATAAAAVNGATAALPSGSLVTVLSGLQSPEARDYPCDHGPTDVAGKRIYSEPSPMQAGDIYEAWALTNQFGIWENWMIVSVSSLGSANYQFVASRMPASETQGCRPVGTTNTWANGWWGYMQPMCDAFAFVSTTSPGSGWQFQNIGSGHTAFGWKGGGSFPSAAASSDVGDPHDVWYQEPLMNPTNPFLQNTLYQVASNTLFAGYSPAYQWQSYPSQLQFSNPDTSNGRWMTDWNALNPSTGLSADQPSSIGSNWNNGTLVGGTTSVWKFTPTGGVPPAPYKIIPPIAYAGHYLLQDVSSASTGNIVTDATPWTFCVAYAVNECRTGSSINDVYETVPQAGGTQSGQLGQCFTNWFDENMPCIITLQYHGASMVQLAIDRADPTGKNSRKITTGFMGPGIEMSFTGATIEPTGQWALFNCIWCNGVRSELFMAQLPPFPAGQPSSSQNFVSVPVQLGTSSAYNQARVRFGYAENGATSNYYCTPRAETCVASSALSPFSYITSDGAGYQTCSGGCTINIPAIPGRVLYYVVDRHNSTSGVTVSSDIKTVANP